MPEPGGAGAGAGRTSSWAMSTFQALNARPWVRRLVDETTRVEPVDRTMVIAAQGLLALLPLLVVLAAFLPQQLTAVGLERFGSVTGIGSRGPQMLVGDVDALRGSEGVTIVDTPLVRAQLGAIGVIVTVLSASSFALAVQRMYERVWGQPRLRGLRARRRCLGWLLAWLAMLQLLAVVGWVQHWAGLAALAPVWFAVKAVLAALIWWWSQRVLLAGRVPWRCLVFPAGVTGLSMVTYASASTLVMPRYAQASTDSFGAFGLMLSLATWLVGFAGVMVVAAVVGRLFATNERRDLRSG